MPESNALAREADGWMAQAVMCLEERTPDQLAAAAELLKGIAALRNRIKEYHAPNIKRWYEGHKLAKKQEQEMLEPVEEAERLVKEKIADYRAWEREQARIATEAAAKLAREAAEADRAAQAEALRAEGMQSAAEILEQSRLVIPAPPPPAPVETKGVYTQVRWSAKIVDKLAVIRFVAENPQFSHLVEVSQKEANSLARAQQQNLLIPGLEAVATESTSVRTK